VEVLRFRKQEADQPGRVTTMISAVAKSCCLSTIHICPTNPGLSEASQTSHTQRFSNLERQSFVASASKDVSSHSRTGAILIWLSTKRTTTLHSTIETSTPQLWDSPVHTIVRYEPEMRLHSKPAHRQRYQLQCISHSGLLEFLDLYSLTVSLLHAR
jgi:hypothetical protein